MAPNVLGRGEEKLDDEDLTTSGGVPHQLLKPAAIEEAERTARQFGLGVAGVGLLGSLLYWLSGFTQGYLLLPMSWWAAFLVALVLAFFSPPTRRARRARQLLRKWDELEVRGVLEAAGAPDDPRMKVAEELVARIRDHPATDEHVTHVATDVLENLRLALCDLRMTELMREAAAAGHFGAQTSTSAHSLSDILDSLTARAGHLLSSLEDLHRALMLRNPEALRRTSGQVEHVLRSLAAELEVDQFLRARSPGITEIRP